MLFLLYKCYRGLRRWARCLLSVGWQLQCPLCRWRFRRFLPAGIDSEIFKVQQVVGGGFRENVVCPRCYSTDRERLLYLYLKRGTAVFDRPVRLLHVAPERNLHSLLSASPNIEYVSADLNSPRAMLQVDITAIQFLDNTFDAIICNHVLEHIPDDQKAMSELLRVLKPGGWAIVQVPISLLLKETIEDAGLSDPDERLRRFGQNDHVRLYSRDYRRRLENVGFSVDMWSAVEQLGEKAMRKHSLNPKEVIYVGRKPKIGVV